MPNRKTNPETIEQALTRLEDMLVDRLIAIRGAPRQAAIAPRSGPARAGWSAYQLPTLPLPPTKAQQRIRDRIAQSTVKPRAMRANLLNLKILASWRRDEHFLKTQSHSMFKGPAQARLPHCCFPSSLPPRGCNSCGAYGLHGTIDVLQLNGGTRAQNRGLD